MRTDQLRDRLDALVASRDVRRHLADDPVSFVHAAAPGDREVVGLVAALLAFGNVKAVRASIRRVLEATAGLELARVGEAAIAARLAGFRHRVYTGRDVARVLHRAATLQAAHGTLGELYARCLAEAPDARETLARFADALRGPNTRRSLAHLVPDPRKGSACKRLVLYLRWMARPADGVDFGMWPVAASTLMIPVDTHVHRIARNLGLTRRKDASWRTATEITAGLARLDPRDPVKYDFAICHLGVSRDCPSRRDETKCARCELRSVCRHWR